MTGSAKRGKILVFVSFLWIVQSLGRLCFAAFGTPEGMGQFLDSPISYTTSAILFAMFLFFGCFRAYCDLRLVSWKEMGLLEHNTGQYCDHSP